MKAHEIANLAASLVGGDRERTHGSKAENFGKIASLWNAYMDSRRDPMLPLDEVDVGLMMVLLKVARTQLGAFNPDDFTDLVGYGACAGEIAHQFYGVPDGREDVDEHRP